MSLLTDTDLISLLNSTSNWTDRENTLHIYPYEAESLTPVGYDLHVGQRYVSGVHGGPSNINPGDSITIDPGETVLIETLEAVDLPQNRTMSALIESKVTVVSRGFSHISTTIDPDWQGKLLIAITNLAREPLSFRYGAPFCTIVFFQNKSPATRPSGKAPGRPDVLLTILSEQAKRKQLREKEQKKRERLLIFLPVNIIVISIVVGYAFLGTSGGFALAAGVALAEGIFLYLRSKYE